MAKVAARKVIEIKEVKEELPIDLYAITYILSKALEKGCGTAKKAILPSCSETKPLNNDRWTLQYSKQTGIRRLDTEAILAKMGEKWMDQFYRNDGVKESIKPVSLSGVDARLKQVKFTPALCEKLVKVILEHRE